MSIIVRDKHSTPHKNDIIVGRTKLQNIYINMTTKKDDRIESMTFDEPIKHVPYLNIDANQRSACYISGMSGTGKSTLASLLVKEYRAIHGPVSQEVIVLERVPMPFSRKGYRDVEFTTMKPLPKKVVIFTTSTLCDDDAFKGINNCSIIGFDDSIFVNITLEELRDHIVIFDDWENISNKVLSKHVEFLIKDLLERSRKLHVDLIIINHMSQQYHKTRAVIFECDTYFVNPRMNKNSSRKFLDAYMDLDKKTLIEIMDYKPDSSFTWACFRKSAPQYMIYDRSIRLL